MHDPEDNPDDLERAVGQAIDLRETVRRLPEPVLHELVDLILIELGQKIAAGE